MFIINPKDDSVLTLKPEMVYKPYNDQYTLITYPGIIFDPGDKPKDTHFLIDTDYDALIKKLQTQQFIYSQWKEYDYE